MSLLRYSHIIATFGASVTVRCHSPMRTRLERVLAFPPLMCTTVALTWSSTVLHLDKDVEIIAAITGQPVVRLDVDR